MPPPGRPPLLQGGGASTTQPVPRERRGRWTRQEGLNGIGRTHHLVTDGHRSRTAPEEPWAPTCFQRSRQDHRPLRLLEECRVTVVRGNTSEILAMVTGVAGTGSGGSSGHSPPGSAGPSIGWVR